MSDPRFFCGSRADDFNNQRFSYTRDTFAERTGTRRLMTFNRFLWFLSRICELNCVELLLLAKSKTLKRRIQRVNYTRMARSNLKIVSLSINLELISPTMNGTFIFAVFWDVSTLCNEWKCCNTNCHDAWKQREISFVIESGSRPFTMILENLTYDFNANRGASSIV